MQKYCWRFKFRTSQTALTNELSTEGFRLQYSNEELFGDTLCYYQVDKQRKPSYLDFDIDSYAWKPDINYRKNPEYYRVGKGEQGVLICEPYKTEIGKHWRFKTPDIAKQSSEKIYSQFNDYIEQNDFVGADMARKFLQMGYTRARRYANYKSGKKYDKENDYEQLKRGTGDPEKAAAAAIFYGKWKKAEANPIYSNLKTDWKKQYG